MNSHRIHITLQMQLEEFDMNRQSGQGLLEYLLIIAVVVLAVVGFATVFRSGANNAQNTMSSGIASAITGVSN